MKKYKLTNQNENSGITLVSLVVTIVILIILSTIAYQTGKGTIESARLSTYTAEMQTLQQKVNELEQEYRDGDQQEKNRIKSLGQSIEAVPEEASTAFSGAGVTDTSGYMYYSAETLEELGFGNFNQEFLVNVEKRDIISLEGVKYNGKRYYSYTDLPNSLYNVERTEITSSSAFVVKVDIQNGMKLKIHDIVYTGDVKKGTIYYGLEENGQVTKWIKASDEISDTSYTIEVLQEGTYQVKIIDTAGNESEAQSVTIHVANYQIAETGAKYETLGEAVGAAKNNETIKQIRNYTDASEVTVDGKSIKFDNNGRELTKEEYGIVVNEGATLEIAGNGTITTADALKNAANGALLYNYGTIQLTHTGTISSTRTGNYTFIVNRGIFNKTGLGTIINASYYSTIANVGTNASLTISAGKISATNTSPGDTTGAIASYEGAKVNVKEIAEVTAEYRAIYLGRSAGAGHLVMTGGTLIAQKNNAIVCSNNSTASIYGGTVKSETMTSVHINRGSVNVGNSDNELSNNTPSIVGVTYGLYIGEGTWNFHNGIIKGATNSYNAGPTEIRPGYEVKNGTEIINGVEYKTAYLGGKEFTVTLDANGGTSDPTSKTVIYNETYGELPTPTREGYTFTGWTIEQDAGQTPSYITAETIVTQTDNHTLYAQWQANTYEVTFDAGDEVTVEPSAKTVTYDNPYGELPTPEKTGYTFNSWTTGENLFNPQEFYEVGKNYGVHINENDITLVTYPYQENVTKTPVNCKENTQYILSYDWAVTNCDSNHLETGLQFVYTDGTRGIYTASGTLNNGSRFRGSMGDIGHVIITSDPNKTVEYISSSGWQYGSAARLSNIKLAEKIASDTIVRTASNHTLYANWEQNRYNVTFDATGGTVAPGTKQVAYNSIYGSLPTPTKEGYTFTGWHGKNMISIKGRTVKDAGTWGNTNKRNFSGDGIYVGLTANNYYSPVTIAEYNIDENNNSVTVNTTAGGYGIGFDVRVSPNTTYTYSVNESSTLSNHRIAEYKEDGTFITYYGAAKQYTFTTTAETSWITIIIAPPQGETQSVFNIQLEKSNTATEYEPYSITTAETTVTKTSDHTLYANWMANTYDVAFSRNVNNLPTEYHELEYIESTGTQYIDTGIIGKTGLELNADILYTSVPHDGAFVGSRNGATRTYLLHCYPSKWAIGYGTYYSSSTAVEPNVRYKVYSKLYKDEQILKINDSIVYSNTISNEYNTNLNLYLFTLNDNESQIYYTSGRIYSLKLYDNGNLVRDFIPCYRTEDNEIGLYDIVGNEFYTNKGKGTFNKGEIMENQHFTYGIGQNLTANSYTRPGYTFTGWNTKPDGSGTNFTDGQEVNSLIAENNGIVNLYAQWQETTLKANTTADGPFLGTSITRNKIKSVSFSDSIGGHTVNNTTCWDVSAQNNGKVLLWINNVDENGNITDENGNVDVVIGQNGGVFANSSSAYLFAYIGKSIEATIDLTNFDTSRVTNMNAMFYNCQNVSMLDVSKFNTSKVTSMQYMFGNCKKTGRIDVSNFDTSNTTTMSNMFNECNNVSTLDVSGFNTDKVDNMAYMFSGCVGVATLDVSNFNTSKVTNMDHMFCYCRSLALLDVSNFDTTKVTNMSAMFYDCKLLTSLDVSNFGTTNVTVMSGMFNNCAKLTTLDVSNFDTVKVTNMSSMFYGCNKLTTLDVSNFGTSKVTNMYNVFCGCSALTTLDVSNFDTSKVTNMDHMFCWCRELTTLDVSNFNTTNVTNMSCMFYDCSALTTIDVSNFNTANVTKMSSMFYNCKALTTIDVGDFNTANVTTMENMFQNCSTLTSINTNNFNTSKVTNMNHMFHGCSALTTLDVSNFNTENVINMIAMFYNCKSLITLDVSNFNTEKVTSMENMFQDCSTLTTLDVSNFDTSNVTTMNHMFHGCSALTTLDVSNFNTSNVTIMNYMFHGCSALTTLDVSNFDTSNVTTMLNMFVSCSKLTILDVSNFDTTKVTNMSAMFWDCNGLTSIDISSFDTSNVTSMNQMFYYCKELTTIYASSSFVTSAVTSSGQMFSNSTKLIGGEGTTYSASHTDHTYAHIDGGAENPGYFTAIASTTITFNANGGTSSEESKQVATNAKIGTLPTATKTDYEFKGWFTEKNEQVTENTIVGSEDVTYYAQWIKNINNTDDLSDIINALPESNIQLEIKVNQDITDNITIPNNTNILLNMQNNTFNNQSNANIINNSGTLEIVNGNIQSSAGNWSVIDNQGTGTLIIRDTTVVGSTKQGICNKGGGTVYIEGNSYVSSGNAYTIDNRARNNLYYRRNY